MFHSVAMQSMAGCGTVGDCVGLSEGFGVGVAEGVGVGTGVGEGVGNGRGVVGLYGSWWGLEKM